MENTRENYKRDSAPILSAKFKELNNILHEEGCREIGSLDIAGGNINLFKLCKGKVGNIYQNFKCPYAKCPVIPLLHIYLPDKV